MLSFDNAYAEFISYHSSRRHGERARRLQEGHGHAEREFLKQVWWPAFATFRGLHPEYELTDFDGNRRFLDFAYIQTSIKLAIEVDGYGPHVVKLSRWQFINQLRRQNHLVLDGWSVLRFSYDEIADEPRRCQRLLQQFMGKHQHEIRLDGLDAHAQVVVRLALHSGGPLTPAQVCKHLGIHRQTAYKLLRRLVAEEWLVPASGNQRIRLYRIHPKRTHQ